MKKQGDGGEGKKTQLHHGSCFSRIQEFMDGGGDDL